MVLESSNGMNQSAKVYLDGVSPTNASPTNASPTNAFQLVLPMLSNFVK